MKAELSNLLSGVDCKVGVHLRDDDGGYQPFRPGGAGQRGKAAEPDGVAGEALAQKRPVQADAGKGRSRLVIPLLVKDEPSGFVDLSGRLGRSFRDDEVEVAQILANQTAVAVENARLYEAIERQAITDGLTGLYNHREFHERLQAEISRARRYSTPVSLLMIDVDDFKSFNDAYGHQAGDEVLRAIGQLLMTGLRRDIDIAARYGGEEFAIILPNTPVDAAHAVGERVRATFAKAGKTSRPKTSRAQPKPEHPGGAVKVGERLRREIATATVVSGQGSPLEHVTVSVGVAAFPEHGPDPGALIKAADDALYAAKRGGKNKVTIAPLG
jgi:diguanylate cyclase (GGDEF)-like protein